MQKIRIRESFPFSVEKLFNHMEVHENLADIFFPLKVETIRYGEAEPYGVGSIRKLFVNPVPPFEESVTAFDRNKMIEYRITKGSPLKSHKGTMIFSGDKVQSALDYSIEFDSDIPFLASTVKVGLEAGIKKGLAKLKRAGL
jgi:hypothetical protein